VISEEAVMRQEKYLSPSKITTEYWIYADWLREGCYQEGKTYVGKWLVFVRRGSVDEVWGRIRQATESGKLGIAAKVSTSCPSGYKPQDHVICVYTYDFRDKANVGEVLKRLRKIGITGKLYYKSDQATHRGVYTTEGPFTKKKERVSLYSSDDFKC